MKTLLLILVMALPVRADIFLTSGDNLQAALNAANCGEHIVLQEGSAFFGNFVLPYKPGCTEHVVIRTNGTLPESRITPEHAPLMASIVSNSSFPALTAQANAGYYKFIGIEITNVGGSVVTQELVEFGTGIPFAAHPHNITFDRVWVHEATNDTTTPNSIITTAIRGFNLNATDILITESRIAGFRAYQPVSQGVEASMAILFPSAALRVTVRNTYLEAWFTPLFFGGSGGQTPNAATLSSAVFDLNSHTGSAVFSSVPNLANGDLVAFKTTGGRTPPTNYAHPSEAVQFQVGKVTGINGNTVSFQSWGAYDGNLAGGNPLLQVPDSPGLAQWNGYLNQDINILQNQFVSNFNSTELVWTSTGGSPTTQPRATQTNTGNAPKGMIEIKMARNLLIEGNTFEGWHIGFTVTSRNQGSVLTSGGFPWSGVFNTTIRNNWWKRTLNWDRIYGWPIGGPQMQDNEYTSVRSGPFAFSNNLIESGADPILAAMGAADNVTVSHNTYPGLEIPHGTSMIIGQGADSSNFIFENNILSNNEYGLNCQIIGVACWPLLTQRNNVILDNRSNDQKIGEGSLSGRYPNDFIAATQASVGWVNPAGGNYRLADNSPYKGTASGGTDPGVDIDALLAALTGDVNPPPPPPPVDTEAPTVSISVTSSKNTFTVNAVASDNVGVTRVELYVDGVLRSSYVFNLPGRKGAQHSVFARAYDAAGNVGQSQTLVLVK